MPAEQGRIRCRDFGGGPERCDAITGAHCHFVCEKCGSASDFSMPVRASINRQAQRLSRNMTKWHTINFHGISEKCAGRAKTQALRAKACVESYTDEGFMMHS